MGEEEKIKVVDIERLLSEGNSIRVFPRGFSMYPLFVPGRDEAVIDPLPAGRRLRRGDVALYRREGSVLVLHRIWRAGHDGLYFVGDNQTELEGPISREQVHGVLSAVYRNGRKFTVENPIYLMYARLWLFLRPLRPKISKFIHFFRKRGK